MRLYVPDRWWLFRGCDPLRRRPTVSETCARDGVVVVMMMMVVGGWNSAKPDMEHGEHLASSIKDLRRPGHVDRRGQI